jgi:hypothetical protein
MKKILLVHGWFLQTGVRLNLHPQNGIPCIYDGDGFWMYHGKLYFKEDEAFTGALYDHCGIAEVRGILKDGKLSFDKCYTHRNDAIHYELVQTSVPEEFSGTYTGVLVGTGKTKLTLAEPSRTLFVV